MPKNIKTRNCNGEDCFDISTQTGNTNTNIAFIKTVISVSANYTKDAILQSTLCEHTNTTTNQDISFLNKMEKNSDFQKMNKQHQNRMIRRQKQGMMMKKGCGCGGK